MKLNNKGMSIVEIVLTFALIMVMVIGMITIVFNYREKASISLEKLDMDTFKNTLTKDIQDDILEKGVQEINVGGECATNTELQSCININFKDGSSKIFGIGIVDSSDRNSVENKFLYYDGLKYKLKDSLPKVIPDGRKPSDFQLIAIQDSNILSTDSIVLEDGTITTLYSIDVYISHLDFDEDFGIHIVTSTNDAKENNELKPKPGDYVRMTPSLTSYTTDTSKTGSTSTQTINPSELNLWRVLKVNSDGTIEMISEYASRDEINFRGETGYKNFVGYLNVLASKYENSTYTKGSRYVGYNGQTEYISSLPSSIATGNASLPESQGGGDTLYQSDYDLIQNVLGTRVANRVDAQNFSVIYWLASREFYTDTSTGWHYAYKNRWIALDGTLNKSDQYEYNNGSFSTWGDSSALRPIVILKSGISYTIGTGTSSDPFVLE